MKAGQEYVSRAELARRYGKQARTIGKWIADPQLNFPSPIKIRGRDLFSIAEINAWHAAQVKVMRVKEPA